MLYLLYHALKDSAWVRYLNFLRYPTFRIMAAGVVSLALGMFLGPRFIARLREWQVGLSNVREHTPASHQAKAGTPTMGGLVIVLSMLVSTLLFADLRSPVVWAALVTTLGCAGIGALDDWQKISRRNSKGLRVPQKLSLQVAVFSLVVFGVFWSWAGTPHLMLDTRLTVPFVPLRYLHPDLGGAYVFFACAIVVFTSNAVNLTDGLDGLAIATSVVAAVVFAVLSYLAGTAIELVDYRIADGARSLVAIPVHRYLGIAHVEGGAELAVFCASIAGAGLSFLWFNAYPAAVFMGDTGSLALGGALGIVAVLSKNELLSVVVNGVFAAEGLSVAAQIISYRLTGRRIFRKAPLHHHYEEQGMSEVTIVIRFWIVSVICGGVALASVKLR